ncbi:MAG: glycosyltransferase family 2 protein [Petrimonas sp.]|uniref:glycosyltransferase family 2 protein n=1 Tax=Dysgonomonadaceae TaxID=2005520 RepID=UPI002B20A0DD|nr:glycosyltransferase family 2 protein [Proteiniphilum sp.]MEA5046217.1 glycosyltransferase family 2 protein [Petrimonas sp.]MEA5130177.1 glycosyltransferase family 2 protein [Proteiniphilum sp.]
MEKKPELSVITVNYNGKDDTLRLIESLRNHLSIPYEFIVVDNGSVEDEAAELQTNYPFIKTIRSERNLGFAGGNNLGVRQASGSYLFFLNNDTFVRDDSISCLIDIMKQNPLLGGLSPKILFADTTGGIQFAGYSQLSSITLRNRLIGFRELDEGQHDQSHPTPYLHGAAMLIRREAIERAGMMPEIYFLYYEELDWSLQIRRQGYVLEYHPSAVIYHSESRSTGQNSPLKAYYLTRNRLLFAHRNLIGLNRLLSIGYQLAIAIPKGWIQALFRGKPALARAMVRGVRYFFRMHLMEER